MGAPDILATCRERGIILAADGDRLAFDAPAGVLDAELRAELAAHKPAILTILTEPASRTPESTPRDWNNLPADPPKGCDIEAVKRIREGYAVPVWSDVLGEWLWWVRDEEARQQLLSEGCRIVIYALGELTLVAGWDAKSLRDIHEIKRTFNAIIEPSEAS